MDEAAGSQGAYADRVAEATDQYLTKRRRQILGELQQLGPELADVYRTALRLLGDDTFPARACLVAHAARELINMLPDYLNVPVDRGRVEYVNTLDMIAPLWQEDIRQRATAARLSESSTCDGSVAEPPTVTISLKVYREIDELVNAHLQARSTAEERLRGVIQTSDKAGTGFPEAQLEPIVGQWKMLREWFVGRAHLRTPGSAPIDFEECIARFNILEDVVYAVLCPFYGPVEQLDEILAETNPPTG